MTYAASVFSNESARGGEISSMEIRGYRLRLLVGTRSDGYIFFLFFPLVGVLPPTNSNYQLYTKAQYYLNAALGVGVEILWPFLWEKIETENPLKRPEHLYMVYAFGGMANESHDAVCV